MATKTESLHPLDAIEKQLDAYSAATVDFCDIYGKIKPLLEAALPWIERLLPRGQLIAKVLRLLMDMADEKCGL
jgi:hypothetical protein